MDEDDYIANGASAFFVENWHDRKIRKIQGIFNLPNEALPVRIGICGPPGVGKTRLAVAIGEELDIPIIQQVPRLVKSMGYKLNQKSDMQAQIAIWLATMHEQLLYENFVADHTLIDHYTHIAWLNDNYDLGLEKYIARALGNLTYGIVADQYSVVFYLPSRGKPKPNGVRSSSGKYQREIQELLLHYLHSFDVEYVPLTGNHSEQLDTALNILTESGAIRSLYDEEEDED